MAFGPKHAYFQPARSCALVPFVDSDADTSYQ